uniref:Uncharacterized protein n=1 Tax=Haptolina ericina TaxID=156174 RepID=A0A7S3AQC1_9EUKA
MGHNLSSVRICGDACAPGAWRSNAMAVTTWNPSLVYYVHHLPFDAALLANGINPRSNVSTWPRMRRYLDGSLYFATADGMIREQRAHHFAPPLWHRWLDHFAKQLRHVVLSSQDVDTIGRLVEQALVN